MIKIELELESPNFDELQTMLELVAQDVGKGYASSHGWNITGDPEGSIEN